MEQTIQTLATFAFGFFLAALPLTVVLTHQKRELKRLQDGMAKVVDGWYEEVKELREALWNERIK